MKHVLISIAQTVPELLRHSALHITLAGWPAAAAVAAVGATIVLTAVILTDGSPADSHDPTKGKEVG